MKVVDTVKLQSSCQRARVGDTFTIAGMLGISDDFLMDSETFEKKKKGLLLQ